MHATEPTRSRDWTAIFRAVSARHRRYVGCAPPSGGLLPMCPPTQSRAPRQQRIRHQGRVSAAASGPAHDSACRSKPKSNKDRRAKAARRSLAFFSPRPQLLEGFTKESLFRIRTPSDNGHRRHFQRVFSTDAFFGASPVVASALGIRSGATPRGPIHSKPARSALLHKGDISTLLGIGHFYFALTRDALSGLIAV
jgi:hypothetical protein